MNRTYWSVAGAAVAAAILSACQQGPTLAPDPCRIAPVTGFQFQECSKELVSKNAQGAIYRHSLRFDDAQSEMWLLYYRPESDRLVPGFAVKETADYFASAAAYGAFFDRATAIGAVRVDKGERFFDFTKDHRRCKGFVRFGSQVQAGSDPQYRAIALLVLCRTGTVPMSIAETRFFTDQLQFY